MRHLPVIWVSHLALTNKKSCRYITQVFRLAFGPAQIAITLLMLFG